MPEIRRQKVARDDDPKRPRLGWCCNETHWACKLTQREVALIRQLASDGMLQKVIAEKFEISRAHVSRIVNDQSRTEPSGRTLQKTKATPR